MANAPCAESIAAIADEFPGVSIGVHLNLTEGRPLLSPQRVSTLVGHDGLFLTAPVLLRKCALRLVDAKQVFDEMLAQIMRISALVGRPTHVDSHQNVHPYPVVVRGFLAVCRATGIGRVRSQRVFHPGFERPAGRSMLARCTRNWFKMRQEGRIRRTGLKSPDRTIPYAPGYNDGEACLSEAMSWWRRTAPMLPEGYTEVITHPGCGKCEARFYRRAEFAGLLHDSGLRIASYADI